MRMDTVAKTFSSGLVNRASGSRLTRFTLPPAVHVERSDAELRPGHPALREGRTAFPSMVFDPADGHRILVSGHNNSKIGKRVVKGPWAGMPIYTITLEERATCPRSCHVWSACYGNSMHMAKRKAYGPDFARYLNAELTVKALEHPQGFVVRVHVLGDFPDVGYVQHWGYWLRSLPQLHVWGYTAREPDSGIGRAIAKLNGSFPSRWRVRFSVAPEGVKDRGFLRSTVVWNEGDEKKIPKSIVCPVERGKSETCGTCGLCWFKPADDWTIVFMGHGNTRRGAPEGPRAPRIELPAGEPRRRGRPPLDPSQRSTPDYVRGYQAGYQAGLRKGREITYVTAAQRHTPLLELPDLDC